MATKEKVYDKEFYNRVSRKITTKIQEKMNALPPKGERTREQMLEVKGYLEALQDVAKFMEETDKQLFIEFVGFTMGQAADALKSYNDSVNKMCDLTHDMVDHMDKVVDGAGKVIEVHKEILHGMRGK